MNTETYRSTMVERGTQIMDSKKQTPSPQACPRRATRMSQWEPLSGPPFAKWEQGTGEKGKCGVDA